MNLLTSFHPSYKVLLTLGGESSTEVSTSDDMLESLTLSEDISRRNRALHEATNLVELEKVFQTLWASKDYADQEDLLLVDIRDDDQRYNSSFLIDWKARIPMGKFIIV